MKRRSFLKYLCFIVPAALTNSTIIMGRNKSNDAWQVVDEIITREDWGDIYIKIKHDGRETNYLSHKTGG